MPRRRKTAKKSKRKDEATALALTLQKLQEHEPDLFEMIREYTLHSNTVPELLATAHRHVDNLHRMASPYANLHNRQELTEKMIAASDLLARAATLSKPLIPGRVTALRRSALPPGTALVPKLTPRLTPAEYTRLWNEGRITLRSGPEGQYSQDMLTYNPSPDLLSFYGHGVGGPGIWAHQVMTPSNYELHKLKTALKILEKAREGFDPVIEELPDDQEAGEGRRQVRRRSKTRRKRRKRRDGEGYEGGDLFWRK